jgi:hypothetical protein
MLLLLNRTNPFLCAQNLPKKTLSAMAPSSTTSTIGYLYHVGGNLYLPDPETCGLKGESLTRTRELQPLLEQLNARDLSRELRNGSYRKFR